MASNPDLLSLRPLSAVQTWPIALLLTLVGGYVDIVGYLSAYQVFTAHMSGNTTDMAKHIYALQWSGIARHAWPILAFVAGLTFASVLFEAQKRKVLYRRFPITIVLESLLLLIFLIFSLGRSSAIPPQPAPKFYFMVGLLALAMGVQNVTIRKIGGLHIYTTFITGTLVQFGEAASQYILWFNAEWRRSGISTILRASARLAVVRHMALTAAVWLCYLGGGVAGTYALTELKTRCVFIPLIVLIAIATYGAARPFAEVISEEW